MADWVYSVAAGIQRVEEYPGYEKVRIAPVPDARLEWLNARLDTGYGVIIAEWKKQGDSWRYDITTPVDGEIVIDGKVNRVKVGRYCLYSKI